jgi:4'-phosphopantetheinyl transferase
MRLLWDTTSTAARLEPGVVHVWAARLDEPSACGHVELLSRDEIARAERFHFARDRRRFVAARTLLRQIAGNYLSSDPADLRFVYGATGKPALAQPESPLRFNLSHSGEIALFAFAMGCELGVDVELERELPEAEGIAERYFSPAERAELRRLAPEERPSAFFRCWTRKEAFIKATGDGLSLPLDAFDVTAGPGKPARLLRVEGGTQTCRRFWLQDLEPAGGFAAALAVDGHPARIERWAWEGRGEERHGSGRSGRQDRLQSRAEPRGAVLDLAG